MQARPRWTIVPTFWVVLSHTKLQKSPRLDVRQVVCCFQPVLLSNGDGLIDGVSCQDGQASLLNQTVGFSVALSPYAAHLSAFPKDLMFSWHIGDRPRRTLCCEVIRRLPEWHLTGELSQEDRCLDFPKKCICLALEQEAITDGMSVSREQRCKYRCAVCERLQCLLPLNAGQKEP